MLRIAAIEALAGNATEGVVDWLAQHGATDPSAEVRVECLRQLDDLPSSVARDLLLKKATESDRRVRQLVASGLRHYPDDEVTRALARLVVDDDVYVQERAIESMAAGSRNGASYLLHLLIPSWEGTHWDSILREHADADGDRGLVERTTASFRQALATQSSPPGAALRWMSLIDPDAVLLFAESRARDRANAAHLDDVEALSVLLRACERSDDSRKSIRERCVALLRVIAGDMERPGAAAKARSLLERWSS